MKPSVTPTPLPIGSKATGSVQSPSKMTRSSSSKTGSGSLSSVSGRLVGGGNSPFSSPVAAIDPSPLNLGSSTTTNHLPQKKHDRKGSAGSLISWSETSSACYPDTGPARFPTAPNNVEIYDSLEREQEAIVNKVGIRFYIEHGLTKF